MILARFTVGPFAENVYVIGTPPRVAIVDPGGESAQIMDAIDEKGWEPEMVLLTHGHLDHIAHVAHVVERYDVPVICHEDDRFLLETEQMPQFAQMLAARPCPTPESWWSDGDEVEVAGLTLKVIHTPGHTPGGVCLVHEESRQIVAGDTIFHRGIGRTDLPGGDMATLERSIRQRLFTLEGDYTLWPGHGPETKLAEERVDNPFFGENAGAALR